MTRTQRLFDTGVLCAALALVLALTATFGAPAHAQTAGKQWEVGFGVGSSGLSSNDDLDLDFRTEGRGGYFFSDLFELELQLSQADAILDASLDSYMLNGVFNFRTDQRVVPYVLVGAGYTEIDDFSFLGVGPDLSDSASAFQVGVGSRFFLGSAGRMAIRAELSNQWADSDLFDDDQFTSLTVGLSWALGSR